MDNNDLSKYDFEKELKNMAVSCIGLKPDTAKKKAAKIFKKYDHIISYQDKDYYIRQYNELEIMYNTLKSGKIKYSRGKNKGILLLKDIEQVEVRENDVVLITKNGREIIIGNDFKYLEKIF